jgi:hypothetical protein
MAVAVERRTREIRICWPSARARGVLRTVLARAGRQLGGGIVAGNSIILLLSWRMGGGISVEIVVALVIVSLVMIVAGVLACSVPARRALRFQPTEAFRQG